MRLGSAADRGRAGRRLARNRCLCQRHACRVMSNCSTATQSDLSQQSTDLHSTRPAACSRTRPAATPVPLHRGSHSAPRQRQCQVQASQLPSRDRVAAASAHSEWARCGLRESGSTSWPQRRCAAGGCQAAAWCSEWRVESERVRLSRRVQSHGGCIRLDSRSPLSGRGLLSSATPSAFVRLPSTRRHITVDTRSHHGVHLWRKRGATNKRD